MSVPVAAEILRGAAREVEKGWCRGMVHSYDGDVCAIGALRRAGRVTQGDLLRGVSPEYEKAARALAGTFVEQYPDQDLSELPPMHAGGLPEELAPESVIWRYNDLVVPDKFAVVAAMEKAANSLEA